MWQLLLTLPLLKIADKGKKDKDAELDEEYINQQDEYIKLKVQSLKKVNNSPFSFSFQLFQPFSFFVSLLLFSGGG